MYKLARISASACYAGSGQDIEDYIPLLVLIFWELVNVSNAEIGIGTRLFLDLRCRRAQVGSKSGLSGLSFFILTSRSLSGIS